MKGKTLEEYVRSLGRGYKVLRRVYEDVSSGRLKIIDPNPPKVFAEYLIRLDYSAWFWASASLIALAVASVYLTGLVPQMIYLRYVVGSILILFMVGYVTVELLYPEEGSLSDLERLALSIGLSLAVVPLLGLVLNYTPWGIRLEPVLTTISLYTFMGAVAAAYRKYQHVRMRL
ncbi:MAG: DUF1616 domain-containing protein [Zestosphaera sp.]